MVGRTLSLLAVMGCGRIGFSASADSRAADSPTADGAQTDGMVAAPDASPLADALGHWAFDDGSGTIAVDGSGNARTISLVNAPTWVPGAFDNAVASTGTNEYLVSPVLDLSATAAATVSVWVKRTYTSGPRHTLFELSDNFNNYTTGFGLFPDDNTTCAGGQILVGVNGDAGNNYRCYVQPTSGVWHHLVAVYDKSRAGNAEVSLYVDGSVQVPVSAPALSDNTNTFGAFQLYLLSRGGAMEFNAGTVDELAIWARALGAAEIAQL